MPDAPSRRKLRTRKLAGGRCVTVYVVGTAPKRTGRKRKKD